MPSPLPSFSISDWLDRLSPALSSSVDEASNVLTKTPAIQKWLSTAAVEAASSLANLSDATAQMQSYSKLMDAFHDQFPELFDAVRQATLGAARPRIDWRPMSPNLSRVELDFASEYDIDLFFPLADNNDVEVGKYLQDMEAHLPKADPYAGHPHQVGAIIATPETKLTVVLEKHTGKDGQTSKAYSLSAPSYQKLTDLQKSQVESAAKQYFANEGATSS